MSKRPILLFLHGVGDDQGDGWRDVLEASLIKAGYSGLAGVQVIAPKYPNSLHGVDEDKRLPRTTVKTLRGDPAKRNRRDYERRRTAMEVLLGPDDRGEGLPGADRVAKVAVGNLKSFVQADNYIRKPEVRSAVLRRILRYVPDQGRVCIVGHSLGSVIAADLLRRLPTAVEVSGMVTIGSPMASGDLRVEGLVELLSEPPSNLAWWVNFWSKADWATTHRGLATAFPWILDQRIEGRAAGNPKRAHSAVAYVADQGVATAVGRALFGSQSRELVLVEKGLDIPTDYAETVALLALRSAHLTLNELEGDQRDRYADALRLVQSDTAERLVARNKSEKRPIPLAVAELAVDLAEPSSTALSPTIPVNLSIEEGVVAMTAIASGNLLRPFEIEVPMEVRRRAMEQLTIEMQLGGHFGTNVFEALERSRKALKGPTNWFKWTALGVGAVAVVAAPVGLALMAAAAGVAGAAAVTSALATFGPGGMIGGLLTAGTLVTAGGGGIAIGLAAPGTTAEAVEAVVAVQLAVAILRDLQGLPQDAQTWFGLIAADDEVSRELARLAAVSDKSAPSVKELQRKLDAINRALDYLERNGLAPLKSEND